MPVWMQTSSGVAVNLLDPDLTGIDVAADIAAPLAVLARFCGHQRANRDSGSTPPRLYSVAQHSVIGADAILEETGDVAAALAFLVHDAHEALIGDITSPAAVALSCLVDGAVNIGLGRTAAITVRNAIGQTAFEAAIDALKLRIDLAMRALAGLPAQLPAPVSRLVAAMDRRMLDLERRQLLGSPRRPATVAGIWPDAIITAAPVRIRGALTPWRHGRAADEWMQRFTAWRVTPTKEA